MMNSVKHQKIPRRYFLYGTALVLVLLMWCAAFFLLWFKPSPTEVTVSGTSAEMGMQSGRAFRIQLKLLTRVYLDKVLCHNNPKLAQAARTKALEASKKWPAPYAEEMHAIAKASGLEPGALAFGNTFLDLGHVAIGCRSAVVAGSNIFLHAHNLDWDNLGGLGHWTTSIVRRDPSDGRFRTVSVGFPGLIGSLDIINEKGLALSFNQLGSGNDNVTEPVFIMMRRIAESCTTVDQARSNIMAAAPGMPFIITVSDSNTKTGSVFERARDVITERPLQNGYVSACNVGQGTKSGVTSLDKMLGRTRIEQPADLQKILSNPEILLSCNLYSVIFDFSSNQLLLASGEVPAAPGPYRAYTLFP